MEGKAPRIPDSVVRRLPVYLRHLQSILENDVDTIASQTLGEALGLNPAQIRKDLAYFGAFGQKGVGYDVRFLILSIERILRIHRDVPVALIGAGRLGAALCLYNQIQVQSGQNRMRIISVFDKDPAKTGSVIGNVAVEPDTHLESALKSRNIRIAVIAVPASDAQEVADRLTLAGVTAMLNFAPIALRVADSVHVRAADFTSELQSLAYYAFDE